MKQKLSVTIDKKTIEIIDKSVEEGLFRNKSHAVEFSLKNLFGSLSHPILKIQQKIGDINKTLREEKNDGN